MPRVLTATSASGAAGGYIFGYDEIDTTWRLKKHRKPMKLPLPGKLRPAWHHGLTTNDCDWLTGTVHFCKRKTGMAYGEIESLKPKTLNDFQRSLRVFLVQIIFHLFWRIPILFASPYGSHFQIDPVVYNRPQLEYPVSKQSLISQERPFHSGFLSAMQLQAVLFQVVPPPTGFRVEVTANSYSASAKQFTHKS